MNAVCGNCGRRAVVEVVVPLQSVPGAMMRQAQCLWCKKAGTLKFPKHWEGITNEARNLMYAMVI